MKYIIRKILLLRAIKNLISETHSLNATKKIINKKSSIHVRNEIKTSVLKFLKITIK